jgi:uncharacterized membrane protein YdbT with pleckstrin-like domain
MALIFSIARSVSAVPAATVPFLGLAGLVSFVIFFIALGYAFLSSWLLYKSHEYCLAEDALKIRQGIMTKTEIAIPYRQIQNINIERTFSEQIMGLSRLIILTAGDDNDGKDGAASEGILPAIDKNLASELQNELIKRADVEKVIQQPRSVLK